MERLELLTIQFNTLNSGESESKRSYESFWEGYAFSRYRQGE